MDRLIIKDASFLVNLGVTTEERQEKQKILADIGLFLDAKKAGKTGDLEDAINYSEVHALAKKIAEEKEHTLIESMAEEIAGSILNEFNVKKAVVCIKKPKALEKKNAAYAAIEITRERKDV